VELRGLFLADFRIKNDVIIPEMTPNPTTTAKIAQGKLKTMLPIELEFGLNPCFIFRILPFLILFN